MTTYTTTSPAITSARIALTAYMVGRAARVAKDIGFGYWPAEDAPGEYEPLKAHIAECQKTRSAMKVYSGGCDKTIYMDAEGNYAFRFLHDLCHYYVKGADFTPAGECLAVDAMAKGVAERFGAESLEYRMFIADTMGQVAYYAIHKDFPEDQLSFVVAALNKH